MSVLDSGQFEKSMLGFFRKYYPDMLDEEILLNDDLFRTGVLDSFMLIDLFHHLESIFQRRIDPETLGLEAFGSLESMKRAMLDG